ncbi:MAG TPA: nodulation protein NfeD [Flavisolibacter sp.]|nr:nodulation protein NfeD [Flavisolibacter sp.]
MKILLTIFVLICCSFVQAQTVVGLTIDGTINPASAGFIEKAIKKAEKENASCVLLRLNTPGGLLKSTRNIVGAIFSSNVPVIVYVWPEGAQAGSAGVFITLAAHYAAMAPGTNIGAAHPVGSGPMDSVMNAKSTNDAVAFIRSIAEQRGRNQQWAEEAVRNSVSITGSEALNKKVIDTIALSTTQLLEWLDGRTIKVANGTVTLRTRQAAVEEVEMGFMLKLLNIISDPNIAYLLLMIGFYGILFELYNPGAILPGIVGGIGLILGLYALNTLPVNYAGLALIIFALILFLLEIKITSHGMLTIGGILSLLLGSFMLIRDDVTFPLLRLSATVIITTTAVTTLFFAFLIALGLKAQRAKPVTGREGMIGETGEAITALMPSGTILLHGELWTAEATAGMVEKGEKVRVTAMKDFHLFVEKT